MRPPVNRIPRVGPSDERGLPPATITVEGQPWNRAEIQSELLEMTGDALSVLRRTLDGEKMNRDAVASARWVLDTNLELLPAVEQGENPDVMQLRNVLQLVRRKA